MSLDFNSELVQRVSRAEQADGFGHDDRAEGLWDRVIEAGSWDALSAEDRAFVEEMNRRVDAGASPTLQDPSEWGTLDDWQAEDAELDDDDEEPDTKGAAIPGADEGDWIGV